jgi:hypothetical protein
VDKRHRWHVEALGSWFNSCAVVYKCSILSFVFSVSSVYPGIDGLDASLSKQFALCIMKQTQYTASTSARAAFSKPARRKGIPH